jgi:hypothetical protein
MATTATSANAIRVGPGVLYAAQLGSPEPVGLTGAWPSAWSPLGLTTDGHTDTLDVQTADLVAAELFEPVATYTTGRTETIALTLMNVTAKNLEIAFNGGLAALTPTGGYVEVVFPEPGQEVRIMLGWDAVDGKERTIWRRVVQTGSVALARQKAPNATTIPCSFKTEAMPDGSDRLVRRLAAEYVS